MSYDYDQLIQDAYNETVGGEDLGRPEPKVCPRTTGERCLLCEKVGVKYNDVYLGERARDLPHYSKLTGILYTKQLNSDEWKYPKGLRDYAYKLRPSSYYYANFIFVNNPSKVYVLKFSPSIFNFLIKHTINEDSEYFGFWSPKNGTNMKLTKGYNQERGMPTYDVEFRRKPSALAEPKILKAVYPLTLENIIEGEMDAEIMPIFPQKELEQGKSYEIRILPWNKDNPRAWFQRVFYHFNISKQEFDMTLAGEFDPFEDILEHQEVVDLDMEEEKEKLVIPARELPEFEDIPESEEWGKNSSTKEPTSENPACYGLYDQDDDDCRECEAMKRCGDKGQTERTEKKKGVRPKKKVKFLDD